MTYTLSDEARRTYERIEDSGDTQGLAWRVQETVRDALAAQRESIAQEIEANAPEWEYAGGIARDAHIRIADRIRRDDIARGAQ